MLLGGRPTKLLYFPFSLRFGRCMAKQTQTVLGAQNHSAGPAKLLYFPFPCTSVVAKPNRVKPFWELRITRQGQWIVTVRIWWLSGGGVGQPNCSTSHFLALQSLQGQTDSNRFGSSDSLGRANRDIGASWELLAALLTPSLANIFLSDVIVLLFDSLGVDIVFPR